MKTKGQFILFQDASEFSQWLDKNPVGRPIVRVQNHHTWSPSYRDFDGNNHFKRLEAMKDYHVRTNRWRDIGQNITTFPDGTIAVCRPLGKIPACIKNLNTGSIGIEHLGNFDRGGDVMTAAHRECIVQLNAVLCRKFKLRVSTDTVVYHHWYDLDTGERNDGTRNNKTCPGTTFFGGHKVADCKANFLPLVEAAMARLGGAPAAVPTAKVLSPDGTLTIRSGPTAGTAALGSLPNGAVVQIHEAKGIWRRIDPAASRWVSSRYLVPG